MAGCVGGGGFVLHNTLNFRAFTVQLGKAGWFQAFGTRFVEFRSPLANRNESRPSLRGVDLENGAFMFGSIGLTAPVQGYEAVGGENEIVEVSLLLPRWQIQALETAARKRGMNTAQMLRRMIGATFAPNSNPSAN